MEFAELIKIPRCDRIILSQPLKKKIEGSLCITGHHLIISSKNEPEKELWLLHGNIDFLEHKQQGISGGTIWLKCKDLRILQIDIIGVDQFSKVVTSLESLSNVGFLIFKEEGRYIKESDVVEPQTYIAELSFHYPFFYQPMVSYLEDGWTAFSTLSEFSRLLQGDEWRVSYVNKDFKICASYPSAVIVPKKIEDPELVSISHFRQGGRFPVLAYRHENGAPLLRSSQPLNQQATAVRRCKEGEKYLSSILKRGEKGYIIDTRIDTKMQNITQSAKLRGNSGEGELYYPNWKRIHKSVDRRSTLLDSLTKMVEACNDTNSGSDKWLTRLEISGWMHCIKETLNCACLVAQCLDQEKTPVLIHDVDGVDSALQVTSLTQIILNPDCRTVRGFEALIEREWVQGGHPFATRHAKSCYTPTVYRNNKKHSPTFLLFLDCVHQIHSQFACSFEFSQNFLIFLFEHSYSSQYGTFLCDNEQDRYKLQVQKRTTSLWSQINRPDVLGQFLSPVYEPNSNIIWPSVAPMSLDVWDELFLRWVVDQTPREYAEQVITEVREKDAELRSKAVRLRRQLQDLEKEALSCGIIGMINNSSPEEFSA